MCNNGHAHCPGPAESGAGSWGDTVKGAAAASHSSSEPSILRLRNIVTTIIKLLNLLRYFITK